MKLVSFTTTDEQTIYVNPKSVSSIEEYKEKDTKMYMRNMGIYYIKGSLEEVANLLVSLS